MNNDLDNELRQEVIMHIKTIGGRLWNHRAALLVGAGFSKNADPNYPDWQGLADVIWDRLHPEGTRVKADKKYVDVMQLAEEFVATFGRPALDALITKSCYHPEVAPSVLHKELLSLPWVDVFTTNYDTLLEKAAGEVWDIKYGYVLTKEDLAYVEKPRIIKLHGSFPSTHPFILTARDYRQYRYDHAPFANTVQQSLLENTFCLVGFSGDDPNFLKWIEWMRHNLGEGNVQKIYLLSVCDMSSSRRELLKDRGIIPIDLRIIAQGKKDAKSALSAFIKYLRSEGDNKVAWPDIPKRFESLGAVDINVGILSEFTDYLSELRNSYPEWLVLPEAERQKLHFGLSGWLLLKPEDLSELNVDKRHKLLTGLVWLSSVARIPMPSMLLGMVYQMFCKLQTVSNLTNSQKIDFRVVALSLLRNYRESGDFDKWQETWDKLHVGEANYDVGFVDELKYEECLCSLYELRLAECARIVDYWNPDVSSSISCVRKVGLLVNLGEFEKGKRLAEDALSWLRSTHSAYNSQKDLRYAAVESSLMITIRRLERFLSNKNEHGFRRPLKNEKEGTWVDDEEDIKRQTEEEQIRHKERQDEEAQNEKKFFDRHYELKKMKSDMTDELKGYIIVLGEVKRHGMSGCHKKWLFDIHEQRLSMNYRNPRFDMMVATSFFRLVEDIGLTVKVGNGFYIDKDLLSCSIATTWERLPCLAFCSLVLYGGIETVEHVLDRARVLSCSREYAEKMVSILFSALNDAFECKVSCEGVWGTLLDTAPEIISRLISKCGLEIRLDVARFVKIAYSRMTARRRVDLDNLIKRLLKGASPADLRKITLEILPEEAIRCSSPWERMHFQHPFRYIGFERIMEGSTDDNYIFPSMSFTRLRKQLQSRERFEYEWGLDTLRVMLHLNCLSEKQKHELCEVVEYRMTSAFPIGGESYYLLLLYNGSGGGIGERFKNRVLKKALHPFDEVENVGPSDMRVRRYVRDMQIMLRDLIKVSVFSPMVIDCDFACELSSKLMQWFNGSRKWVDATLEHGSRIALNLLILFSDVMSKVVIPRLSVDECAKIRVIEDSLLLNGDVFIRWRLAMQLRKGNCKNEDFEAWAWEHIRNANSSYSDLAFVVLEDIAHTIPDVCERILLKIMEIIKIRGYMNSISLFQRLGVLIADENITMTKRVVDQLRAMLGDIMKIGQYQFARDNAIPIEQCMSLRSCAVRIALLLVKTKSVVNDAVHEFVEYWCNVAQDESEFLEVRVGA